MMIQILDITADGRVVLKVHRPDMHTNPTYLEGKVGEMCHFKPKIHDHSMKILTHEEAEERYALPDLQRA